MPTATFIKDLDGFVGHAALYELSKPVEYDKSWGDDDPPAKTTTLVIVSSAHVMFSGPETYIFAANKAGAVLDWSELAGSQKGSVSHEEALADAGYKMRP